MLTYVAYFCEKRLSRRRTEEEVDEEEGTVCIVLDLLTSGLADSEAVTGHSSPSPRAPAARVCARGPALRVGG